jgi:hypothetical protein
MKHIITKLKGSRLTIEVQLSRSFGPSQDCKTTIAASSEAGSV